MQERRATPDVSDPRNPAYYQVQTYCGDQATIAPNSIQTQRQANDYNNSVSQTGITAPQSCVAQADDGSGVTRCFGPVSLVPLVIARGHAEINEPISISFSVEAFGTPYPEYGNLGNVSRFYLTNRSVPYPVVPADPTWAPASNIVDGNVAPPRYPTSAEGRWIYTAKGCGDNQQGASDALAAALETSNPAFPRPSVAFEAHHLQPSCFNGANTALNGIWLPGRAGRLKQHQKYSTWFATGQLKDDFSRANFTP